MKQHMYTELLEFLFKQICHINYLKLMNIYKHIYCLWEKRKQKKDKKQHNINFYFIIFFKNKFELTIFMPDICDKQRQNCPSKTKKIKTLMITEHLIKSNPSFEQNIKS